MYIKLTIITICCFLNLPAFALDSNDVFFKKINSMFSEANPGIDAHITLGGNDQIGRQLQICKNSSFSDKESQSIDIDFLSRVEIPITDFGIVGFNISSLQGLRNFKLTSLSVRTEESVVLDLSPLRNMPLKRLTIINPKSLKNYDVVVELPLEMLALRVKEFPESLQTLIGKLPIKDLSVEKADIVNLEFICNLSLENLYLNKTKVSSLEPIQNTALKSLAIYNSPIADLTPLQALPLEKLTIVNCPVRDLSPLAKCPLKRVTLTNIPVGIKELAVLFDKQLFSYDISISGWNVDGSWRVK